MATSESKGRFFLQNESIRIDSYNESNRFESRIGMLYKEVYFDATCTVVPGIYFQLPSVFAPYVGWELPNRKWRVRVATTHD